MKVALYKWVKYLNIINNQDKNSNVILGTIVFTQLSCPTVQKWLRTCSVFQGSSDKFSIALDCQSAEPYVPSPADQTKEPQSEIPTPISNQEATTIETEALTPLGETEESALDKSSFIKACTKKLKILYPTLDAPQINSLADKEWEKMDQKQKQDFTLIVHKAETDDYSFTVSVLDSNNTMFPLPDVIQENSNEKFTNDQTDTRGFSTDFVAQNLSEIPASQNLNIQIVEIVEPQQETYEQNLYKQKAKTTYISISINNNNPSVEEGEIQESEITRASSTCEPSHSLSQFPASQSYHFIPIPQEFQERICQIDVDSKSSPQVQVERQIQQEKIPSSQQVQEIQVVQETQQAQKAQDVEEVHEGEKDQEKGVEGEDSKDCSQIQFDKLNQSFVPEENISEERQTLNNILNELYSNDVKISEVIEISCNENENKNNQVIVSVLQQDHHQQKQAQTQTAAAVQEKPFQTNSQHEQEPVSHDKVVQE